MTLHHTRTGAGDPVLLLHGLGGTHRLWDPIVERLAPDHEVIAIDMPGFGQSPALNSGRPASGANLAAGVAEFLDAEGIGDPHVVGNSLGGWVGLELGRAGAVRTITLLSTAGLWRKTIGPRQGNVRQLAQRVRPALSLLTSIPGVRQRVMARNFRHPHKVPGDVVKAMVMAWVDAPGYEDADDHMRAGRIENLDEITVPVTVAWAEHDTSVGPPKPERRPPDSEFVVLADCGHVPMFDDPDQVTDVIRRTIARG